MDSEEKCELVIGFLGIIENRIIDPIINTNINKSCTATLLLLFAAIDCLGKLRNPKKSGVKTNIQHFLEFMGPDYNNNKEDLLRLRHCIMHNAINFESYLSHNQHDSNNHLKKLGHANYLYVNTNRMTEDFKAAFHKFKNEIENDEKLMKNVFRKLEVIEEDVKIDFPDTLMTSPTPPPPIQFALTKQRGKCF